LQAYQKPDTSQNLSQAWAKCTHEFLSVAEFEGTGEHKGITGLLVQRISVRTVLVEGTITKIPFTGRKDDHEQEE